MNAKMLVKRRVVDELVMLITIDKPRHQPQAETTMMDLVDKFDEDVVGMIHRVVKARKKQRDGATIREQQQISAETAGSHLKARVSDLWSNTIRFDVQLARSQPKDRRKIFAHTRAVKDVTLQNATVNAANVE